MQILNAPKKVKDVADDKVVSKLAHGRDSTFNRFPLLANNPYVTLVVGLITLLITGTLYKKL